MQEKKIKFISKKYAIAQLDEIPSVTCPCGQSKRAFIKEVNAPCSVHLVEIKRGGKKHYHKKLTEIYIFLEGSGYLEIDEEKIPVKPLTAIMIFPLCRHKVYGALKLVNISLPPFDPRDEWFD